MFELLRRRPSHEIVDSVMDNRTHSFRGPVPRMHEHLVFFVDGEKVRANVTTIEWVIKAGVSYARVHVRRKGKQWTNTKTTLLK